MLPEHSGRNPSINETFGVGKFHFGFETQPVRSGLGIANQTIVSLCMSTRRVKPSLICGAHFFVRKANVISKLKIILCLNASFETTLTQTFIMDTFLTLASGGGGVGAPPVNFYEMAAELLGRSR